jgi:hypothetical protein
MMGQTLQDRIGAFPKARQKKIDARYRQLKGEVENLSALHKATGKAVEMLDLGDLAPAPAAKSHVKVM